MEWKQTMMMKWQDRHNRWRRAFRQAERRLATAAVAGVLLVSLLVSLFAVARVEAVGERFGVVVLNANPSGVTRILRQLGLTWWFSFDSGTDTYGGTDRVNMVRTKDNDYPNCNVSLMPKAELEALVQARPGAYWLIGNEPNAPGQDDVTPACYAQVFDTVVTTIKGRDSSARIVGPNILNWTRTCNGCEGFSVSGKSWFNGFIQAYKTAHAGTYPPIDVWSIHTYSIDWANLTASPPTPMFNADIDKGQIVGFWTDLQADPAMKDKPIWVTEFGVIWGYRKGPWETITKADYLEDEVDQYIRKMGEFFKTDGAMVERFFLYANVGVVDPVIHPTRYGGLALMTGNDCLANPTRFGSTYQELAGTSAQGDTGVCAPAPPPPSGGGGGGGGGGGATPTPVPGSGTPTGPTADQPINPAQGGAVRTTNVTVAVPSGVVSSDSNYTMSVAPSSSGGGSGGGSTPAAPGTVLGSAVFTVTLKDSAGNDVHQLDKPLDLTVNYTDADVTLAGDDASRLHLRRFDEASGTWIDLGGSVNATSRTVTAQSDHLSLFGLAARLAPPTGLNPPGGSTLQSFEPVLTWSHVAGTAQYQIQVLPHNNDGPAINLIIGAPDLVALRRFEVPPPVFGQGNYIMLPGMSYTWRVRTTPVTVPVSENDTTWSDWTTGAFRTPAVSSATLSPVSPVSGSAVETLTPSLRWRDQNQRVFYYEVQVSADPQFVTDPAGATAAVYWNLVHGGITDPANSYAVPASSPLGSGTTYHWRVRPRVQGDGLEAAWSDTWAFRTPN